MVHVWVLRRLKVCHLHQGIHDTPWNLRHLRLRRGGRQRRSTLLLVEIVIGGRSRHHGRRGRGLLLVTMVLDPAPFLLELGPEKVNSPPSFFLDFLEDGEDFLLLFGNDQAFRRYG